MGLSIIIALVLQIFALSMLILDNFDSYISLSGLGGSLVYSIYVCIDLKIISDKIEIDDYILGAITLYVDLITLFIHILQIFGKKK